MFGYVIANGAALTQAQETRYRGCYCGLCRALKERHGNLSRLTLTYDMTFLILLLGGMYEPREESGSARCAVHPLRARSWWRSRFTDYAADMNIALAYHNCLDDYRDDKTLLSLGEARLLRRHYALVRERWPRQCAAIEQGMEALSDLEQKASPDPDAAANRFGVLLGEIFAADGSEPVWTPRIRAFGEKLGKFLYMMDACVDLERDRKKGSYNPLALMNPVPSEEEREAILHMLIGESAAAFEALPIVQDADILRNVLYSGVWTRYALARRKAAGKTRRNGQNESRQNLEASGQNKGRQGQRENGPDTDGQEERKRKGEPMG